MNRQNLQQQWTDYLDDRLAPAHDQTLAELLAAEPAARDSALRDAELHGLLLALGRIDASQDTFVNDVVGRLTSVEYEVGPWSPIEPPRRATPNPEPIAPSRWRDVSRPPVPPASQDGEPEPPPLSARHVNGDSQQPVVADADRVNRTAAAARPANAVHAIWNRHRWTATLCAAALVWLICLGLVFVVAKKGSPPVTDRPVSSPPGAEPGHDTAERPPPMPAAVERPEARDAADVASAPKPTGTPRPGAASPQPIDVRPPVSPPRVVGRPPNPPPPVEPSPAAAVVYGRIVDDSDATWASQSVPSLSGGPNRLRSGTVKIEMINGTSLVVQAPAEFELLSPKRFSLALGQVAATVPAAAVGFAVQTPSSQVVDLGTAFVVDVDDEGATAVQVVRGEVEVSAAREGEDERRWRLGAGQYKWVSGDGGQDFDWRMQLTVDEDSFAGRLNINGREFPFANAEEFIPRYAPLMHELSQLRRLLLSNRRRGVAEPFRAEININGQRSTVSDVTEYARTYRRVNDQLQQLWTKALRQAAGRSGGAFRGSFNINGEEFRIDSFDDLLKLQEEIKRRAGDGFFPLPDDGDGERGGGEPRPANPFEERKKVQ